MASGTAGQNFDSPSDGASSEFASMSKDVDFEGLPKNFIKYCDEASISSEFLFKKKMLKLWVHKFVIYKNFILRLKEK